MQIESALAHPRGAKVNNPHFMLTFDCADSAIKVKVIINAISFIMF